MRGTADVKKDPDAGKKSPSKCRADAQTSASRAGRAAVRGVSRVTWIGFWVNLLLCAAKVGSGVLGNSRALIADGVHSVSDMITDVAILVGVRYWSEPADAEHPYGHQRVESLISLCIGVFLAAAGLGIAWDALGMLGSPPAHAGSRLALGVALLSVVSKELLFRWTLARGRQLKSEAVIANAWAHRSDAVSSLPIVLTLALTLWIPGLAVVDLVGALVVAGFILRAAWKICLPAVNTLIDRGAGPDVCEALTAIVLDIPGVLGVHGLRTRYLGQALFVDLHVCVDGDMSVRRGNELAHTLEDVLCSPATAARIGLDVADVLVHVDPDDMPDD